MHDESDLTVDQVLELSEFLDTAADPLYARKMFGGYGIYLGEAMFALVAYGTAYFKVDSETIGDFEAAGCEPFYFEKNGKEIRMTFWTLPDTAWDTEELYRPWVLRACDAARRALAKRKPKKRKKKA
ncbi:MAG: TfoX/Sxy family protein [Verrucomicrobiota bacterium]